MRRKMLAIGSRAERYDLTFPRTLVVRVAGLSDARAALQTERFDDALLASDRDGYWIDCAVEQLRSLAPNARLVVVVPGIDEGRAEEITHAGADYCVPSWLAVMARGLLRAPPTASRPRQRRRLH